MDPHSHHSTGLAQELLANLPLSCRRCNQLIDRTDHFCRQCGSATGKQSKLYYKPLVVLVMLFFLVGPLALPLLFKSPDFSPLQKGLIAVVNLLYTAWIISYLVKAITQYAAIMNELGF
jgi:hypothetical protein